MRVNKEEFINSLPNRNRMDIGFLQKQANDVLKEPLDQQDKENAAFIFKECERELRLRKIAQEGLVNE